MIIKLNVLEVKSEVSLWTSYGEVYMCGSDIREFSVSFIRSRELISIRPGSCGCSYSSIKSAKLPQSPHLDLVASPLQTTVPQRRGWRLLSPVNFARR